MSLTKREAAVITAYTGLLVGSISDFHAYVEEKFGRPVFTHEFADKDVWKDLKVISRTEFINIEVK